MKTIHFQVDGTQLSVNPADTEHLIRGTKGFYELHFDLSDDYIGFIAACEFQATGVTKYGSLVNGKCILPDAIAEGSSYKVRLIAKNGSDQIVTNRVLIEQEGVGL